MHDILVHLFKRLHKGENDDHIDRNGDQSQQKKIGILQEEDTADCDQDGDIQKERKNGRSQCINDGVGICKAGDDLTRPPSRKEGHRQLKDMADIGQDDINGQPLAENGQEIVPRKGHKLLEDIGHNQTDGNDSQRRLHLIGDVFV
ncbi:hypothetical protein STRDD11_01115 [Streptococcus sp. DD11]|nr:hypothetical protein STRDD11_01115 [Streptococcus sp. DD11]